MTDASRHTPDNDVVLTTGEIADRWKCSTPTVRSMIKQKKLKGFKLGQVHRVSLSEVLRHEGKKGETDETDEEKALAALDRG